MQDSVGDRTGDTPTSQDLTNCEAPDEFPLFLKQNSMEALHENVEWTEVIKVLTPFSGGIYRERKIFAGLLRPADYVRNIEVPQIM